MINNAVLVGRLTRDPQLKYTNSGTAVASFSLAVDRQFKNSNGRVFNLWPNDFYDLFPEEE